MQGPPDNRFAHWKDLEPGGSRSRWTAIGVTVAVVAVIAYGGFRLIDYMRDTPAPPQEEKRAAVGYFRQELLRPGDCFSDDDVDEAVRASSGQTSGIVPAVRVVPCTKPHTAEVYDQFDVPPTQIYPGKDVVLRAAAGCDDALTAYRHGASTTGLTVWILPPTLAAWERGIGHGLCVAVTEGARPRRSSLADEGPAPLATQR